MADTWQNTNALAPNFQSICRDECAIEDPDVAIPTGEYNAQGVADSMRRSAVFREAQAVLGAAIARGEVFLLDPSNVGEEEIYAVARECVDRIQAGECARFVLNTGQFPDQPKGLVSYKTAQNLTQ